MACRQSGTVDGVVDVLCFSSQGISFELGAVTVDPQTSAYDPSPLKGYLQQLNVPYFYEEQGVYLYDCTNLKWTNCWLSSIFVVP